MDNKEKPSELICKNCGSEKVDNYCSNCGQKVYTNRFTIRSFFKVFFDAFSIEKGFLHTLKMLFVNPGILIREYLHGRTRKYFNPLKYAIIIAGIDMILAIWFKVFDTGVEFTTNLQVNSGMLDENVLHKTPQKLMTFIENNLNLISLLFIPLSALISKMFFRREKLLYSEHLIVMCFLITQILVIQIFTYPLYLIFPVLFQYPFILNFILPLIYLTYGLKSFFRRSVFLSSIGSIVIHFGAQLMFMISIVILFKLVAIIASLLGYNVLDFLSS